MKKSVITKCTAKRAGKKDGRKGYPPVEFDGTNGKYSDFEKRLSTIASAHIHSVVRKWQQEEAKILRDIRTLAPEIATCINRCNTLLDHYKRIDMHVTTEPPRQLGKWALLLLALLFLFEGAVNIYTFRFLREPGITTVVIGLALAFLIPFGGFRSGQVLKAKGKTLIERILPLVLILASVSLILVVANGRKFAIEARHLNPRLVQETFMIFLFMNVLFFIFAFYDGYANSYTYPHLQKAYNELKRRKRQYMNRRALLEKAFAKMLGEVKTLQESANELSVAYRRANREVRGNISPSELPKYFHTDFNLPIEFPKEIESYLQKPEPLNEYCNELKTREKAFSDGQEYLDQIDDIFNKGK